METIRKIPIGDLPCGSEFRTLLTKRSGTIASEASRSWVGIRVTFADGSEKCICSSVLVEELWRPEEKV